MTLKLKLLLIIVVICIKSNSQKKDSDSLINNAKLKITTFFIQQGILDKNEVKNNPNFVFASELKEQKVLGYNANGVYVIGVFQSHSEKHILIKEKSKFKIFNIKKIDVVLKEIINYSIKNAIQADLMLFYIEKVIQMYYENYKTLQVPPIIP